MKKIIFTTAAVLFFGLVWAQDPEIKTELPTILGPSPTVAALMKFEEVPVNNYTGIPNISIPLFSSPTHSKDINIAIVLNYHAGSNGLIEHASDVGLGWSLAAGGTISRTVRGFPDEYFKTKRRGIYQEAYNNGVENNYHEILETALDYASSDTLDRATYNEYIWNGMLKGWLDTEHDLWQFNFMGNTGRFYIEKDSLGILSVKPLSDNRLKIVNHYNTSANFGNNFKYTPLSFDIYDENGYKYVFDVVEKTRSQDTTVITSMLKEAVSGDPIIQSFTADEMIQYDSAFHLSKIFDNNGNEIVSLNYRSEIITESTIQNARTDTYQTSGFDVNYLDSHNYINLNPPPAQVQNATIKHCKAKKLEQIHIAGFAKIDFNFEPGRIDENFHSADSAYVFKGIVIKTENDVAIKKVTLDHINTGYKNRLKLARVAFGNFANSDEEAYSMDYYPSLETITAPGDPWNYLAEERSVYPESMTHKSTRADLLLKMTLPTGGCSVFDFEQNTYSYIGDIPITDFYENEENQVGKEVSYDFTALSSSTYPSATAFTIDATQDVQVEVNVVTGSTEVYSWYYLIKRSDSMIRSVMNDAVTYPESDCVDGTCTKFIRLEPGNYKISFDSDTPFDFPPDFHAYITVYYRERATQVKEYLYGGGNRIKRISYFTEDVAEPLNYVNSGGIAPAKEKHYDYRLISNKTKSSGALVFKKPLFEYDKSKKECVWQTAYGNVIGRYEFLLGYHVISKLDNLQSLRTQGADVGYKHVAVYETGNGRTEFTYTSPLDWPETFEDYNLSPPFMPTDNIDYKRGLLKNEKVYSDNDILLKENILDYEYTDTVAVTGLRLYYPPTFEYTKNSEVSYTSYINYMASVIACHDYPATVHCFCYFGIPARFIRTLPYKERFGWAKLTSKTTKDYFYTPDITVTTTDTLTYNNINKQLASRTTTTSTGDHLKTEYYYHTGNSPTSDNRISAIERIVTKRNNVQTSEAKIIYDDDWDGNNAFLPKEIQTSKAAQSLETRLEYASYDEFGNLTEVRQPEGTPVSYVWGYNKTLPVAKIEGRPSSTIMTLIENATDESDTGTEANLIAKLAILRNASQLEGAMVTTYTYKPLVGISSITDPKGLTTYYEYDEFGRLKFVVDAYGRVLSKNEYEYAEPNYVKTTVYKKPLTTTDTPNPEDISETIIYIDGLGRPIQQIAGGMAGDGSGDDIITHIKYDSFGRQAREYLPYTASQNLAFDASAETNTESFYSTTHVPATHVPYSEKIFEDSPLNRVLEQAAPGEAWANGSTGDHTIKFVYSSNEDDEVKKLGTSHSYNSTSKLYEAVDLRVDGYYDEGELYKTITKDENWTSGHEHTTEEFKDGEGRIVLKRTYGTSIVEAVEVTEAHDTYYVYDRFGNLAFVVPPKVDLDGVTTMPSTILDNLCYQYIYDGRNRLAEKKLPGKQWEYIVYDKLDRVAMTGPAFQPFGTGHEGWLFTKYDLFGRVAYTGWKQQSFGSSSRKTRQAEYDDNLAEVSEHRVSPSTNGDSIVGVPYTNEVNPVSLYTVLSINYYDNYNVMRNVSADLSEEPAGQTIFYNNTTQKPKGMPTGSWVRVLEGTQKYEFSVVFYDSVARPIRNHKRTWLGGYTQTDTNYDFAGKTRYTITTHKYKGTSVDSLFVRDDFTYTPQDRPLSHIHTINELDPQLLAHNTYDALGQLINKDVGGTDLTTFEGFQKVDYTYNIRGWLTGINDVRGLAVSGDPADLFAFKIKYDEVDNDMGGNVSELYNGNISETFWRTGSDDVKRSYGYKYDALNRLRNAYYQKPQETVVETDSYNESLEYDKNGNITALDRNGEFDDPATTLAIDALEYDYEQDSNKLLDVTDTTVSTKGFKDVVSTITNDYDYDANGNMVKDSNKHITGISYNHLNLPVQIDFFNSWKINYIYNAQGAKVRKTVTSGNTVVTDYLDGFQYVQDTLRLFPHAEGYVNVLTDTGRHFNYAFNYTDHLGNIRLTYGWDPTQEGLKIMEEINYYPFGLRHANYNVNYGMYIRVFGPIEDEPIHGGEITIAEPPLNFLQTYKYKYNGKEFQDELGLNFYDYGARNYDPAIGRWMNIDPLAEISRRWSPYNYCYNNPVYFIDPDGMRVFGQTKDDAKKYKEDINNVLKDTKFDNLRNLITISGRKFDKIDSKDLASALEGVSLSTDEQAYVDMVTNTINSKEIQTVEYLSLSDNASADGATALKDHMNNAAPGVGTSMLTPAGDLKASMINVLGGEGLNVPVAGGSHSFIIETPSMSAETRAETSGHEVMGHGIPSSRNESSLKNNANAIRTSNLIRRLQVSPLPPRDGADHGGGKVANPTALPYTR